MLTEPIFQCSTILDELAGNGEVMDHLWRREEIEDDLILGAQPVVEQLVAQPMPQLEPFASDVYVPPMEQGNELNIVELHPVAGNVGMFHDRYI
ncbi:hypothetical protein LINPERHAP1_LOCUS16935, partial [Linum perenne]